VFIYLFTFQSSWCLNDIRRVWTYGAHCWNGVPILGERVDFFFFCVRSNWAFCVLGPKKYVFLVKLFLQNWFFFFFFYLVKFQMGEKRSEMVVDLILRYEKNGIWIEYIIPLYYSTFWRRGGTAYIRQMALTEHRVRRKRLNWEKNLLMRTGRDWHARWPETHVVFLGLADSSAICKVSLITSSGFWHYKLSNYYYYLFISRHLGPVILTSAILKKGRPHQVTRTYLPQTFCLPWHRHSGKESRFYVTFKGSGLGERSKVTCPRSQARWSMTGIEPTMFGSRVKHFNH
jgi:hypothetical protein